MTTPDTTGWSEATLNVARDELKFHRDRIAAGSDSVTTIGQNILILVGAGVLVATQLREGIVLIPLFWSAWLLHSLQRGRDTLKHLMCARILETRINEAIGEPVLAWSNALTGRNFTPFITTANFVYWALLNLASWVTAGLVLVDRGHPWAAVALGATAAGILGAAFHSVATYGRFEAGCEEAMTAALDPSSSAPGPGADPDRPAPGR